jgi:VLRF1 release factor-like protein
MSPTDRRPAAGGGRWVYVDPERLPRWLAGFVERHGPSQFEVVGGILKMYASDGALAECHPPPGAAQAIDPDAFGAAVAVPRRLGLLLVRRGGIAAGVAAGDRLIASKVDGTYVQGRTAAGGWSQQRFARRRDNQTREVVRDAIDIAVRILVPEHLDALVGGGDRQLVDAVLLDPRLEPLRGLRAGRFLDVPDPRLAVLQAAVRRARSVRIRLLDQPPAAQPSALPNVSQAFGCSAE